MYYATVFLVMITPLAMLGVGFYWKIKPPKQENARLAYRTQLSVRSDETWRFAHCHMSKLWGRLGLILTILSAVLMVVCRDRYMDFWLWVIFAQMVFFCVTIFLVEGLLKASFDEKGNSVI